MSFEIVIEGQSVLQTITAMEEKIREMPPEVQQEFVAWQTDDMNRKRPSMTYAGSGNFFIVETIIYPRARKMLMTPAQRAQARRKVTFRSAGRRPILRPALFVKLRERMKYMLALVSWH